MITIRPSDGDVKPGGPLGAFREEQAMSRRHRVPPSPFLSSSSHSRPTHTVVCPSGAWNENRPHSTSSIRLVWNPKREIVQLVRQWNTHTYKFLIFNIGLSPIFVKTSNFDCKLLVDLARRWRNSIWLSHVQNSLYYFHAVAVIQWNEGNESFP